MKRTVKWLAKQIGLTVASAGHSGARYITHPPSTAFDSTLLRVFPRLRGLTFIQVGANDGRRLDPIHRYVGEEQWRGVMVEPLPFVFERLTATYRGNARVQLVRAALDREPGDRSIFYLSEETLRFLPDWACGLASLDRSRLQQAVRELAQPESIIAETKVPTLTWADLWARLPEGDCDVLIVDTEGYDLPLLGCANLELHRPRIIHFEHACAPPSERMAFCAELLALGYEIATDGPDTTAWRTE